MAAVVAAKGYAHATVADVVTAASVSRRTFYEQFSDLESCFLAAYQDGMELLLDEIRKAVRAEPSIDWRRRARVAVAAYFDALAERPAATWAYSIEAVGAGPRVLEHRAFILSRWVAQWRELQELARREEPEMPHTPDDHLLLLVGGIEELVRDCLRTHGADQLPRLASRVTDMTIATLETHT